ncbi:HAD superfamily hydrolase [Liquorilactobacillus mali]|uniref:HAD superfamily hydrolase n=2 Tax=Liquorilactobacillus mali TaxID=1618 RepID=A0A0R2G0K8_9LACO|nr:HAD superfamily hydrolase [Liquorilactobacillus mali]
MEENKMKKKYQTLLFDIDDTLLDFGAAENEALEKLFSRVDGVKLTDTIKKDYKKFNQSLWKSMEQGKLSREKLLSTRFTEFFNQEFGIEVDNNKMSEQYLTYLSQGHQEVTGAHQLLNELQQQSFKLFVVTNGVERVQTKRLADSHFDAYFTDIFISEQTGYQKPNKKFFNYVFNKISDFDSDNSLIIGDSLTSDIAGGINAGIDTVWFNPEHKRNLTNYSADYTVHRLSEIKNLLIN